MTSIDTVVIGAGHAGLAVSSLLSSSGRDHVVLDRGGVAERWRTERWDSLHLLTPNWMTRLPGWSYRGQAPEGYLAAAGFVSYLEEYAASFDAPVQGSTWVEDVSLHEGRSDGGYTVSTSRGTWSARHVVVATGPWGRPHVPAGLERAGVPVVPASAYRNPGTLPPGGILVVGASASGVQIADELARSGRDVVLAVGRPHPDPASLPGDGDLLVAGADREAGAHHRRQQRPVTTQGRVVPAADRTQQLHGKRLSRRPGRAPGPWRAAGRPFRRGPPSRGTFP